jgi:hypothetical protein
MVLLSFPPPLAFIFHPTLPCLLPGYPGTD